MPVNADIIAETLPLLLKERERFHYLFYETLSEVNSNVPEKLDRTERSKISAMFYACLETFLMLHDKPELLEQELIKLYHEYNNVGLQADVMLYLKEAFLQALERFLGKAWTRGHESAWDETIGMLYTIIADTAHHGSAASKQPTPDH